MFRSRSKKLDQTSGKLLTKPSLELYETCKFLPLWNFLEISDTGELKYLVVLNNRTDYLKYTLPKGIDLAQKYEEILDEYSELDKDNFLGNKIRNKAALFKESQAYQIERAKLSFLSLFTYGIDLGEEFEKEKVEAIKYLKGKGYKINEDDLKTSLEIVGKRVHHHVGRMESIQIRIRGNEEEDSKKSGSTFDRIMVWIDRNGLTPDPNMTVSRYLEVKRDINGRVVRGV